MHEFQFSGRTVLCVFFFFFIFVHLFLFSNYSHSTGIYTYIHVDSLLLFFAAFSSLRMFYTWSISNSAVFFSLLFFFLFVCSLAHFQFKSSCWVRRKGEINVRVPNRTSSIIMNTMFISRNSSYILCIYIYLFRKHLTQIYNTLWFINRSQLSHRTIHSRQIRFSPYHICKYSKFYRIDYGSELFELSWIFLNIQK